jgi:ABC-2 type transport system ATP-binding protein
MLFLDEPTSGADPITRANFWNVIKELAAKGVTVFVTTHYMDEAENCNRMVLIYHGAIIAQGSPQEMKNNCMKNEVLEVVVNNAQEWLEVISKAEAVKDAALFGSNIHAVVYDSAKASAAINAGLKARGAGECSIKRITPSLEDVFVSSIENYDREHKE